MAARKKAGARPARKGSREERTVGYAVIGCGYFAQKAVLPAFAHARKTSRLAALVTGSATKRRALGRKYGVPVYGYEELEECIRQPEVDAVYITLPNSMHAEYAVRAARAGAHVLCEKPLALTEEECRRMINACEENDVRLMAAYRLHFDEANLAAVEAARQGKVGEPRYFTSSFSLQVHAPNIRLQREKGGGVLWDIGVYCINTARALFMAEPIEAFAFINRGREERFAETEEGVAALLRFPGDRLAAFNVSFGATGVSTYDLVGTEGSVRLDNAYEYKGDTTFELTRGRTRRRVRPERDQLAPELNTFSECVREGREPEPNGWEGLADVRVVRALYESAHLGRPVTLEPFEKKRRPEGKQARRQPPSQKPELVEASSPRQ